MCKFKQGKRLIISLICLMIVTLVSFSCVFIEINREVKTLNEAATEVALDGYLDAGPMEISAFTAIYAMSNYFTIATNGGLSLFASMVNNGFDFSSKTIKMLNNIDCGGSLLGIGGGGYIYFGVSQQSNGSYQPVMTSTIKKFSGTFDGNGKTLSNFRMDSKFYWDRYKVTAFEDHRRDFAGLFCTDGSAVIKNVKFRNYSFDITDAYNGNWLRHGSVRVALISNGNGGRIENCVIENFNINNTKSGEVTAYVGAFTFVDSYQGVSTAPVVENCFLASATMTNISSFTFGKNATECVSCVDSVFAEEELKNNCYQTKDLNGYTKLSSISSIGGNSGTIWFYNSIYNNGWPYLRSFVSFGEYNFGVINGTLKIDGDANLRKLTVPTHNVDGSIINHTVSSNSSGDGVFYGYNIDVEANEGYEFNRWTFDEDTNTYLANFVLMPIQIRLNSIKINYQGNDYEAISARKMTDSNYVGKMNSNTKLNFRFVPYGNSLYIWSDDGYSDTFYVYSSDLTLNPHKDIWDMHTLDKIKINQMDFSEFYKQSESIEVSEIASKLKVDVVNLAKNGITIDITFKLKSYGLEVK